MTIDKESVLIVDDDEHFQHRLRRALERRGHPVTAVSTVGEALAALQGEAPEWAVVDLRLGAESGLDVVRAIREADRTTRVVMLTGYGTIPSAVEATRLGADEYLTKPIEVERLLSAFRGEAAPDAEAPSLAEVEWEHIHRVLADCGQNISEASRRLGIHRRSLQRKIGRFRPG